MELEERSVDVLLSEVVRRRVRVVGETDQEVRSISQRLRPFVCY